MMKKIIEKALEIGFNDVEISATSGDEASISLFNGNIEKNFVGKDTTYILKGIINGKMALYRFQKNNVDLTDEEILNIVNKLKENVLVLNNNQVSSIFEGSEHYETVEKVESGISNVSTEEKINLLKKTEQYAFKYDPRIELCPYCQYVEQRSKVIMMNSKGLNLSKENEYCGIVFGCVAGNSKEDPAKQNGFEIKVTNKISELNPEEIAKKACDKALSMLGACPTESNFYPVILERDAMSSLLQGFFSMFTATSAIKHLTALENKLGEKIMSEKISIIDDPLMKESIIKEPFDAEGVATYKKEVVKDGVFKLFLQNLKTAKHFNTTSTGNASLTDICGFNFHIANGDVTKEEMIAKIDKGLLIDELSGLHAGLNPISGDFSCQSSGYLIENGKITKPVTLVVLSGNFLKMMNDVECVGSDLKVDYQGFGSPSIFFKSLSISGN